MDHDLIPTPDATLTEAARAALALRDTDPAAARSAGQSVGRRARASGNQIAAAISARAVALAALDMGDVPTARRAVARSVVAARQSGDAATLAGCLTSSAAMRFISGSRRGGFAELDEAVTIAQSLGDAAALTDALAQRAWMLQFSGRSREALATVDELLAGDRGEQVAGGERASLLVDRACILAELARFGEAIPAFDVAIDACEIAWGADAHEVVEARRNRAVCLTVAGRIAEAMRAFDELAARMTQLPMQRLRLLVSQAELLFDARLTDEADHVSAAALAAITPRTPSEMRGEALLVRAQVLAVGGDAAGAARCAHRAERAFMRGSKLGRAAVAAAISARHGRRSAIESVTAAAIRLDEVGLRADAAAAWADAATRLAAAGRPADATEHRRRLAEWLRSGPALTRAQAWAAEAALRAAEGAHRRADRAILTGLDILDEHRASLGGTELRALASGVGEELAALGVSLAIERRDADRALRMSERWRAGIVLRRPAPSGEFGEALAELRETLATASDPDAPPEALVALDARRAGIEERVRRAARLTDGVAADADKLPSGAAWRTLLDDATLVEYLAIGRRLVAVVVRGGRSRLVDVGTIEAPVAAVRDLGFALRRLARPGLSTVAASAAMASATESLQRLSSALIEPLGRLGGAGDHRPGQVVVVPTAALHAVPWPALPGLHDRIVSVAPSATWWATASRRDRPATGVVAAAGPRLSAAPAEVAVVGAIHRDALVLDPAEATAERVSEVLDGADLVHLACHFRPRSDHPHMSAIELADGPFTVYDLERLGRAPRRVVLAACESGLSAVRPGEELLGFISCLLSLGTIEVLASVVPVPDVQTVDLMRSLHSHLVSGAGFAAALHHARHELLSAAGTDPASFVVATAFVPFAAAQISGGGDVGVEDAIAP